TDPADTLVVGIRDHRHDQSAVQGDRDPDVDGAPADDRIPVPGRVDLRVGSEHDSAGPSQQIGEADLVPGRRQALIDLGSEGHERIGFDLRGQPERRNTGIVGQAFGGDALIGVERHRRVLRRPLLCRRFLLRRLVSLAVVAERTTIGDRLFDVDADDPAAWARPLDLSGVDIVLLSHLPCQRRDPHSSTVGFFGRAGRVRWLFAVAGRLVGAGFLIAGTTAGRSFVAGFLVTTGFLTSGRLARVFGFLAFFRLTTVVGVAAFAGITAVIGILAEDRDAFADGDRRSFLDQEAADDAGVIGLEIHGRLVGLDLTEDIALRDFVADLDVPPRDDAFLHRVGQARHEYVGHLSS